MTVQELVERYKEHFPDAAIIPMQSMARYWNEVQGRERKPFLIDEVQHVIAVLGPERLLMLVEIGVAAMAEERG